MSEPRPSGVKPGRHRCRRAAAAAAGDLARRGAGCAWARRPSSPSSCPWRTRPCWSCRARSRRRRRSGLDDGGVVGRAPALQDPRAARRRDAPGAEVVLERDRARPASGPGSRPAATAASTASACAARLVAEHGQERVELAVARRPPRPAPPRPRHGPSAARRISAAGDQRASPGRSGSRRPRRRSAAPGSGGPPPPARRPAPPRGRGSGGARRPAARSTMAIGCDDGSRWARSSAATSAAWSSTVRSCAVKRSTSASVRSSRARRATWTTSSRLSRSRRRSARGVAHGARAAQARPTTNSTVRASISSLS